MLQTTPTILSVPLLVLIGLLLGAAGRDVDADVLAQLRETQVLRVCADPDNLPFSSRDANTPGYDVELA
jgi:hypothetical protein